MPIGRADLSVLVGELEGLHQTQGLVHGSANLVVIYQYAAYFPFRAYDEKTSIHKTEKEGFYDKP